MAARRTRAQKEKTTAQRAEQHTYSFSSQASPSSRKAEKATTSATRNVSELFSYDSALIYRDLSKTVVITSIVLATLLGVRFFLS
jgi:hypothetical protein